MHIYDRKLNIYNTNSKDSYALVGTNKTPFTKVRASPLPPWT